MITMLQENGVGKIYSFITSGHTNGEECPVPNVRNSYEQNTLTKLGANYPKYPETFNTLLNPLPPQFPPLVPKNSLFNSYELSRPPRVITEL